MSAPTTQAQSTSEALHSTLSAEFRALNTDYLMLVSTTLICPDQERPWRGLCAGTYRLVSRSGRSYQANINHPRERIHPSGEYLTLLAGLSDLLKRIRAAGREPNDFTLMIFSGQELVVRPACRDVPGEVGDTQAAVHAGARYAGPVLGHRSSLEAGCPAREGARIGPANQRKRLTTKNICTIVDVWRVGQIRPHK